MTMSDIANSAKVTLIWRGVIFLLCTTVTAGVGIILSFVSSANTKQDKALEKLDSTASDVAQIKWELPVIKQNAANDKAEILRTIQNLEERFQTMRNLTDQDRKDLAKLQMQIELLKQRLQLP